MPPDKPPVQPPRPRGFAQPRRTFAALVLFTACADRDIEADPNDPPSCAAVAGDLLEHCGDAYVDLLECVEQAGVEACDRENLAHSGCLGMLELDVQPADPAFGRYVCEASPEPDSRCEEEIAACPE